MEVVPTSDGDEDDGVIWFRCPQCQGFLPKLSGADLGDGDSDEAEKNDSGEKVEVQQAADETPPAASDSDETMPWDSPADMMAAQAKAEATAPESSPFLPEDEAVIAADAGSDDSESPTRAQADESDDSSDSDDSSEPIHEYAALLASQDVDASHPYRPWDTYEVGQCIHHLAWEDCGVVVAKEDLPGGRKIIKCYFEDAGVVRLIEQAPR